MGTDEGDKAVPLFDSVHLVDAIIGGMQRGVGESNKCSAVQWSYIQGIGVVCAEFKRGLLVGWVE